MNRTFLAVGLVVALVAVAATVPRAPAPTLEASLPVGLVHVDSRPQADGTFREVFRIHRVSGPAALLAVANVSVQVDGLPRGVTWSDPNATLAPGVSLWFDQEAFDARQVLTATGPDGSMLWSCRFGGGAGQPYSDADRDAYGLWHCLTGSP